ncbi:hypothetical protein [Nitrosospira sp. Nsp13]|uniref:hypothetical protein n=1 Tax=Nitrosospira sp. Nsp13 TaxID=1855332 RepID=UPI000B84223C|nr:hypothetical protein [Nitrosospira sp. Nsp13]
MPPYIASQHAEGWISVGLWFDIPATAVHIRKKVVVSPNGIDDPMTINASILADLSLLGAREQGIMGTPSRGMNVAFADLDICCHCEERSNLAISTSMVYSNPIRFLYLIIR